MVRPDSDEDLVFRALADPARRRILDILRARPGMDVSLLAEQFSFSRYGLRKHLLVLERANLVSHEWTRPHKHYYLNAVPIRMIYDRWISEFSSYWSAGLTELKYAVEQEEAENRLMEKKQRYVIYIKTTPERLWQALTSPEESERYYVGCRLQEGPQPGGAIEYFRSGERKVVGRVLEVEPGRRLVHTFGIDPAAADSRVTYTIEPMGETVRLTLTHENLPDQELFDATENGWQIILSGLKTYLETGEALVIPF